MKHVGVTDVADAVNEVQVGENRGEREREEYLVC